MKEYGGYMVKKTIYFLFLLSIIFMSSCTNIESHDKDMSSSMTLQKENPDIVNNTTQNTETTTVSTSSQTEISETQQETSSSVATSATDNTTVEVPSSTVTVSAPVTSAATTKSSTVVTTTAEVTTTQHTTTQPVVTTKVQQNIGTNSYTALNYPEQKAVWISYLEYLNILKGKSQSQFTQSVKSMYDNCVSMGINTVYVHARSHSDAYYQSDYYPWSKYASGTAGISPGFDPFAILVKEAHNRGLSIHAWVNPLRGMSEDDIANVPDSYLMKQWYNNQTSDIVKVKGIWYLNPAYQETNDLICNGIKEIISKYDVDGIHIDDYFYPTTDNYFDDEAFSNSGSSNRTQWRLNIVSNMVRGLYSSVKATNPTVLFGVSPQGNIDNNYNYQYADVRKWASQDGYLDYLVPQIYFGFRNATQPYERNLQSWCDMVTNSNVSLVVGLAPYKIGTVESTGEWASDTRILARQVEAFKNKGKYGGAAFFRYENLFCPSAAVAPSINTERQELVSVLQ